MDNMANIQTLLNHLVGNQQDGKSYLNIPSYCEEHGRSERQLLNDLKELEGTTTVQPVDGRLVFCRLIVGWTRTDDDVLIWLPQFLVRQSPTQNGYSLDKVASLLGVTRRSVYSYVEQGRLLATKIGGRFYVSQDELDRFTGKGVKV